MPEPFLRTMPKYEIQDRLFSMIVVDAVDAVTQKYAPPVTPGVEVVSRDRFAASILLEVKSRLEDFLNGLDGNGEA